MGLIAVVDVAHRRCELLVEKFAGEELFRVVIALVVAVGLNVWQFKLSRAHPGVVFDST